MLQHGVCPVLALHIFELFPALRPIVPDFGVIVNSAITDEPLHRVVVVQRNAEQAVVFLFDSNNFHFLFPHPITKLVEVVFKDVDALDKIAPFAEITRLADCLTAFVEDAPMRIGDTTRPFVDSVIVHFISLTS